MSNTFYCTVNILSSGLFDVRRLDMYATEDRDEREVEGVYCLGVSVSPTPHMKGAIC